MIEVLDGWRQEQIQSEMLNTQYMSQDAIIFQMLKPEIKKDGNQWCCIYGNMPVDYIAGFGDTPEDAVKEFIKDYKHNKSI